MKWTPFPIVFMIALSGCVALTGCQPVDYTPAQAQDVSEKVSDASEGVTRIAGEVALYAERLAANQDSKIGDIAATVQKYADQLSEISQVVEDVSTSVAQVEQSTDSKFIQTLELIRAGNTASAPVNPYAGPIEIVLGLATAASVAWGSVKSGKAKKAEKEIFIAEQRADNNWRQAEKSRQETRDVLAHSKVLDQEKAVIDAKYKAHKQGIQKTLIDIRAAVTALTSSDVEKRLYNNIGQARKAAV